MLKKRHYGRPKIYRPENSQMRYKIKVDRQERYVELLRQLEVSGTPILVRSDKRFFVAIENAPEAVLNQLRRTGAEITPDYQYQHD